jgi:cytochrome c biogenesis protein CcmG/thiol:disulfide interchange protein DsbE
MSAKRLILIIAIAVAAIAGMWGYAHFRNNGGAAKQLVGTTTQGQSFSLAAERGKVVVINFFGSWCGPCNEEAPQLAAFAKAHPNVVFLGVANDQPAAAVAFMKKYGLTYAVIPDPDGTILNSWGVSGVPTTVFINSQGVEKARLVGANTEAGFEIALQGAE